MFPSAEDEVGPHVYYYAALWSPEELLSGRQEHGDPLAMLFQDVCWLFVLHPENRRNTTKQPGCALSSRTSLQTQQATVRTVPREYFEIISRCQISCEQKAQESFDHRWLNTAQVFPQDDPLFI